MSLPAFDNDIILQYLTGNREGEKSGFRIHRDGRLDRMHRDSSWVEDKPLTPDHLTALQAALTDAGLEGKPRVYRPEVLPDDATSWSLQAHTDSQPIALQGEGCRPAFVDALITKIAPSLQ